MRNFYLYFSLIYMSLVALLVFLVLALPANAQDGNCGANNGTVQAHLAGRYGETIIEQQDVTDGRVELWANDETGSYTILFFPAGRGEAVVCIDGVGVDPALIDQSEPV